MITKTGYRLSGKKLIGEGMEYMDKLREIIGKLLNHKTYKGYR